MNFWHMQLHEDNINWQREEEVLEKVGYIGMGVWTETKLGYAVKSLEPNLGDFNQAALQ